jgi:hypothetical protein
VFQQHRVIITIKFSYTTTVLKIKSLYEYGRNRAFHDSMSQGEQDACMAVDLLVQLRIGDMLKGADEC